MSKRGPISGGLMEGDRGSPIEFRVAWVDERFQYQMIPQEPGIERWISEVNDFEVDPHHRVAGDQKVFRAPVAMNQAEGPRLDQPLEVRRQVGVAGGGRAIV